MDDHFSLVRELRSGLHLVVRVLSSGESSVDEWDRIRGAVTRALLPLDEARKAVVDALRALNRGHELAPS